MQNFITGCLLGKNLDVYCGGSDKFNGTVTGCTDGTLTLETGRGINTYVAVNKIVAIWVKSDGESTKQS